MTEEKIIAFWRDGKCIELDEAEAAEVARLYAESHPKPGDEYTSWDDVIAHPYAQYKLIEPMSVFTESKDPSTLEPLWYELRHGDYIKVDHIEMCPAYSAVHVDVTVLNTSRFLILSMDSFEHFAKLFRSAGEDSLALLHHTDDKDRYSTKSSLAQ